ncbi:head maturation protease, ClpP-related [Weissella viridescens]
MKILEIKGTIVDDETAVMARQSGKTVTSPADVKQALANEEADSLDVFINSGGGDVMAGSEIYATLRTSEKNINVKVVGLAGSAASIIAMAGNSVAISPSAFIMIHNASTRNASSDAFLETINQGMLNVYALKTKLERQEIENMMSQETWMTAGQAVNLGFADSMMFENEETSQLVAEMKDKIMDEDKTPEVNNADVLKSIDAHLAAIEKALTKKADPKEDDEKKPEVEKPVAQSDVEKIVADAFSKMLGLEA